MTSISKSSSCMAGSSFNETSSSLQTAIQSTLILLPIASLTHVSNVCLTSAILGTQIMIVFALSDWAHQYPVRLFPEPQG